MHTRSVRFQFRFRPPVFLVRRFSYFSCSVYSSFLQPRDVAAGSPGRGLIAVSPREPRGRDSGAIPLNGSTVQRDSLDSLLPRTKIIAYSCYRKSLANRNIHDRKKDAGEQSRFSEKREEDESRKSYFIHKVYRDDRRKSTNT